jgi:hypothetical protein
MTKGHASDACDRRDVADEVEIEIAVERHVDRVNRTNKEQRVTVRRRPHDNLGADIGGRAWPVVDDKWLAEPLRQPLAYQSRYDVGSAAGSTGDDKTHRPRRIGLRPCNLRRKRQYGSARGQMQKISAGKFQICHCQPPRSAPTARGNTAR